MKKYFKQKNKNGYTIIETMISVSLFIIIVMEGTVGLLNANLLHQKSRDMRSIIDNLSFVMDDMSKNLRTGYNYQCFYVGQELGMSTLGEPKSCPDGNGWAVAFEAGEGNTSLPTDQWIYFIGTYGDDTDIGIYKSIDGGVSYVRLTSEEIFIDYAASNFSVFGAESPLAGDMHQPFVTIKLVGYINFKNVETPFSLQTSVSQRQIDI